MKIIHRYKNKAYSEVTSFKKAKRGFHESDLIRLRIVPANGDRTEIYMHALEALDIISALSQVVAELVINDNVLSSED